MEPTGSMFEFPFKLPPYKHQLDCWNFSRDRTSFALFLALGVGKSKILIDTGAYHFLQGWIKGLVVIPPKGVLWNWYDKEVPQHMSDAVKYQMAYWSSAPNKEEREKLRSLMEDGGEHLRILLMNCEAFTSIENHASEYLVKFLKKFPSTLAIDESTTLKNRSAARTKVLTKIGRLAKYRRILTGNPVPNGPMDLYSQAEFLEPKLLGFSNFFGFRNRFAVLQNMRFGARSFLKIVGYRDTETLVQLMRKFSFIIRKEDCLDLPPQIYQTIDVEMSEDQKRYYNQMVQESFILLDSGATVSAQMVMTQLTRLHQITAGFLATDQGNVPFEPNPRIDALLEILEQAEGKVIIWSLYRFNIVQVKKAIQEKFGAETLVEFWGDTSTEDRREATKSFEDPASKVRFMLSNPATGKFGSTWIQGTTVVYFTNSYDWEHREQSEARSHRIGQCRPVLYIDLRCRKTVDDRILKVLKEKKKLTDHIVASNWRWLMGEKVP